MDTLLSLRMGHTVNPLQRYLKKSKLSQSELARRSGIAQALICRYAGGLRPGMKNAIKLSRATDGELPVTAWTDGAA